jgi:hypothetical protein
MSQNNHHNSRNNPVTKFGFYLKGQPPKHKQVPLTHTTVLYIKKEISNSVRYEDLTAVTMTITISLDDITYFGK